MKEKLFGRGRRGGVLIIAGAVLGAAIAGPGATIAQKAMNLTTTTGDKRYVKRSEVPAAGAVVEGPTNLAATATTFQSLANTSIKAPGPGTLIIHGSLSAKDAAAPGVGADKLQYRLTAGGTPLNTTAQAFELFLPTGDERQNGSIDGIAKVARKGPVEVKLEGQLAAPATGADVLGRSLTVQFVPKAKVTPTKGGGKKKGGDTGGGGNVGP